MQLDVRTNRDVQVAASTGSARRVYLVDAASSLERRVLTRWVSERETGREPGEHEICFLPPSRRSSRGRIDPRLEAVLAGSQDPQFVPVRLIWHPPQRDGAREARLRDLLAFGDPRDPGWLRQHWIVRRHRDRWQVVVGEPALLSELRQRWQRAARIDREHTVGLAEFIARQAALALERAERRQRGARYKVPRFVHEEISTRPVFRAGLAQLARALRQSEKAVAQRALRNLREIAATHSPFVIDLVANLVRMIYRRSYAELVYDRVGLERVAELLQRHPVCFLPSHKSNLDHLVLQYALHENRLPPNHTAGGDNMNFFPVGPLVRRSGVFFIRRSFKDDQIYKFVLHQYIDYLIEKRFSLEWYIEGGRSRSGKLLPPRYGLLAYVIDAWRRGKTDDVVLLPVAITYDQIQDLAEYVQEHRGQAKERESWRWLLRVLRRLRRRYGNIHIRFGEPLSLTQWLGQSEEKTGEDPEKDLTVRKIAFEVCVRMNRVTPITPISLLAMALLSVPDRALTLHEICVLLSDLWALVERRGLPVTAPVDPANPEAITALLAALEANGVAERFAGGPEPVYALVADQALIAAYYRNTIVHFFLGQSLAELALLAVHEEGGAQATDPGQMPLGPSPVDKFWWELARLRDLFKFEFFFPDKDSFRHEVAAELVLYHSGWENDLHRVPTGAYRVFEAIRPYVAPGSVRALAEAYRVVAHALLLHPAGQRLEEKRFLTRCMGLARQYHLQRRVRSVESISQVLFRSALGLAENQGLLAGDPTELTQRRHQFAVEWDTVVRRLDIIEALSLARLAAAATKPIFDSDLPPVRTASGDPSESREGSKGAF